MARKKKPQANPDTDLFLGVVGMSANQIVAFNLALARSWRRWTQEEAAAAIEPYLGVRWSKASVSQAERSVNGNFVRNFSADEIVAFAQAFEVPVTWFFMPPPPRDDDGFPIRLVDRDGGGPAPLATLIDLVFGTEGQQAEMALRLDAWLAWTSPDTLTEAQRRVTDLVTKRTAALLRRSFRQVQDWQTSLHAIANQLEELERAAKRS
ncbi:MAG: helix-turn-helix domain-containing protein, partial [Acidimicrobiales bacterium]